MSATVAPKFKSIHPFEGHHCYSVPNECVKTWVEVLKDLPQVDRAAGICSGGEIGFYAMLPKVRKACVLVDHSTRSISMAAIKWLMIAELGVDTVYDLFMAGDTEKLHAEAEKLLDRLPEKLRESYKYANRTYSRLTYWREGGSYYGDSALHGGLIKQAYTDIPKDLLGTCSTALHRVEFLHGDMTDLAKRTKFDMLYISNALDHGGRNGHQARTKVVTELLKCLNVGGYLLAATGMFSGEYNEFKRPDLKKVGGEKGKGKQNQWFHAVYQVVEPTPAQKGAWEAAQKAEQARYDRYLSPPPLPTRRRTKPIRI